MNVIKQQKADFLASVTKNKNPKNTIPFRSDRVFGELADVNSYQIRQHNATARGVWFDISFSEYRQLREQKKCFYTGIDLLLTDEIPTKEKTPLKCGHLTASIRQKVTRWITLSFAHMRLT